MANHERARIDAAQDSRHRRRIVRRRLSIGALGAVGLAGAAVATTAFTSSPSVPPPGTVAIGTSHVAVLPNRPAALDTTTVLGVIAPVRAAIKAPPLSETTCLDQAAARYARQVSDAMSAGHPVPTAGAGATSTGPGCPATVRSGFVVGADPTGVTQANAAYGSAHGDPDHPSALIVPDSKYVGYGLVAEQVQGQVTGYVLAWVVG